MQRELEEKKKKKEKEDEEARFVRKTRWYLAILLGT